MFMVINITKFMISMVMNITISMVINTVIFVAPARVYTRMHYWYQVPMSAEHLA